MASPLFAGSLASSAQANLTQSRDEHMLQQMQSAQGNKSDAQIDKGAKEFESMLLSTWLQQAEQSMATVPGAEDDESGGSVAFDLTCGVGWHWNCKDDQQGLAQISGKCGIEPASAARARGKRQIRREKMRF